MKHAITTPLLKKNSLNPELLSNYRPISNLSFISKLIERCIAMQIWHVNSVFNTYQCAYRPMHSCETALVYIQDDTLLSLDNKKSVILVLLDLSAAFSTIDHHLLIDQLHRIGMHGNAICWLKSSLSQRTLAVYLTMSFCKVLI